MAYLGLTFNIIIIIYLFFVKIFNKENSKEVLQPLPIRENFNAKELLKYMIENEEENNILKKFNMVKNYLTDTQFNEVCTEIKNDPSKYFQYYDIFIERDDAICKQKQNIITDSESKKSEFPPLPGQKPLSVKSLGGGFSLKKRSGIKHIFLLFGILLLGVLNITKIVKSFFV
jgi:hypothetical protein